MILIFYLSENNFYLSENYIHDQSSAGLHNIAFNKTEDREFKNEKINLEKGIFK